MDETKNYINIAGNILFYSKKNSIIATLDNLNNTTPDKWKINTWDNHIIFPLNIIYNEISSSSKYHTSITNTNHIYLSNDYGNTFYIKSLDYSTMGCCDVAISVNEQYQVIITNNNDEKCSFIYISDDYGMNWNIKYCNIDCEINMKKVSISETGQYIVICGENTLLYSSNFGEEWNMCNLKKQFNYLLSGDFSCIKISANGQYQTLCSVGGNVYLSTNFGMFWNLVKFSRTTNPTNPTLSISISYSYSGQFQIIVDGEFIWHSYNYGETWSKIFENKSNDYWLNGVLSSCGKYIFAINDNNEIYYSYNLLKPTKFTWTGKDNIQKIFITDYFIYITSNNCLYKCSDKLLV